MAKVTLIKTYLSEFIALLDFLKIINAKEDGRDRTIMLLCSLSSSYKILKNVMIYRKTLLTFDDDKDNFLSKEKFDSDFKPSNRSVIWY